MSADAIFTKENLDFYFKELAKEFRRLNGKTMKAEIILTGGAAILVNYGFRAMTYDVDALIHATSVMKEAINHTGDKLGLPNGWLNSDFVHTRSYSPKVSEYSQYYKTFSNILTVRTISGEYLIAMKLMAGREYKNDLSDVIEILYEQEQRGTPLSLEQIQTAAANLYGSWETLPESSRKFLNHIFNIGDIEKLYEVYREQEKRNREALIEFEEQYPHVANNDNVGDILKKLKEKKKADRER